jgi:hypothetical protein
MFDNLVPAPGQLETGQEILIDDCPRVLEASRLAAIRARAPGIFSSAFTGFAGVSGTTSYRTSFLVYNQGDQ